MILPHPVHVIMHLEQRRTETLAETARDRRAILSESSSGTRASRHRGGFVAVVMVIVALALLVTAGSTAAREPLAALIVSIAMQ